MYCIAESTGEALIPVLWMLVITMAMAIVYLISKLMDKTRRENPRATDEQITDAVLFAVQATGKACRAMTCTHCNHTLVHTADGFPHNCPKCNHPWVECRIGKGMEVKHDSKIIRREDVKPETKKDDWNIDG